MRSRNITIAAVVIALIVGIFIGTKIKKTGAPAGADNTYQAGWEAAMKNAGAGLPMVPDNIPIKQLSGTIKSISGSSVTVSVVTPGLSATPELATRTITINGSTKIEQLVQRDPADVQKDMQAFEAQVKAQASSTTPQALPTPPQIKSKQDAQLSDLKVGQSINVMASDDIKNAQQFVATEIDIQATMTTPTPANMPTPPAPVAAPTPVNMPTPPTAAKLPTAPTPAAPTTK